MIDIPHDIFSLKGQRVNGIKLAEDGERVVIHCSRDARRSAIDPATGKKGSINQRVRRQVNDIPLFGYPCVIEIELAQVFISKSERRIEGCDFVDKGCRFTHRLAVSSVDCAAIYPSRRFPGIWVYDRKRSRISTRRT